MESRRVIDALRQRLKEPLPGVDAQRTMAPHGRIPANYDPNPPGARQSGVLILVVPGPGVVFIRRADDGGHHAGQIAFPGGGLEEHDVNLRATALRETEEEIGVPTSQVEILGELSRLFIPVSNYSVLPVVGVVNDVPDFVPEPGEVDEVLVLPLAEFPAARSSLGVYGSGGIFEVPAYRFPTADVWGATAMIFAEFLALVFP